MRRHPCYVFDQDRRPAPKYVGCMHKVTLCRHDVEITERKDLERVFARPRGGMLGIHVSPRTRYNQRSLKLSIEKSHHRHRHRTP